MNKFCFDPVSNTPQILFEDYHETLTPPLGQCDACPAIAPVFPSRTELTTFEELLSHPPLLHVDLDRQHRLIYAPDTAAGPTVVNCKALSLLEAFSQPCSPQSVLATAGERERERLDKAIAALTALRFLIPIDRPVRLIEKPTWLTVWLHTTNSCNLKCSYCYLRKGAGAMSLETGQQAIAAIFRSAVAHNLRGVRLKYAGGEPTLHFDLVLNLHQNALRLADQHSIQLNGVIISNGVQISDSMMRQIKLLGLHLTISLDGLGNYHNVQRPTPDGNGSFCQVAHTVERALDIGVLLEVSITLTKQNLPGLPELISWLLERDIPFGINFYHPYRKGDPCVESRALVQAMRATFSVIESNLPRRSLLSSIGDRMNLAIPHNRPCGVGQCYLVVDPQGGIAKCQMELGQKVASVTAMDPLSSIQSDPTGLQNLPVQDKKACQDCAWRYWCAGGCPLVTFRTTGRHDSRSPYCSVYQAIAPDILRLEGLRLLKYKASTGHD